MRILAAVVCGMLSCFGVAAQDHASHASTRPVTMVAGLGDLHHPVSTSNAPAQQFFDQGLRFIYAFNHDEAARSFQHAADLDPKLAVAYWGVAEAVGPNYNDPASADRFKAAHEAIQKAVDLSAHASPSEQAYIQAMAKKCGNCQKKRMAKRLQAPGSSRPLAAAQPIIGAGLATTARTERFTIGKDRALLESLIPAAGINKPGTGPRMRVD